MVPLGILMYPSTVRRRSAVPRGQWWSGWLHASEYGDVEPAGQKKPTSHTPLQSDVSNPIAAPYLPLGHLLQTADVEILGAVCTVKYFFSSLDADAAAASTNASADADVRSTAVL